MEIFFLEENTMDLSCSRQPYAVLADNFVTVSWTVDRLLAINIAFSLPCGDSKNMLE